MNESEQTNINTAPAGDEASAQAEELPAQIPLAAEQIESLKERACKADEYWDRLLRQTADFDNYKKRVARERQDAVKYANEGLLSKLIPVLDTFEMALAATNAETGSAQSLQAGIAMIQSQLKNVLVEAGLEEIDAIGKKFDPNFHETVAQKETAEFPEDHVVQQIRKGYKFRDRLVRAASVIIAKPPVA